MGRRSDFERIDKDKYHTIDQRAIPPLLNHLKDNVFVEPCAGKGCLLDNLVRNGLVCSYACDIEPESFGIDERDAMTLGKQVHTIITNPPWNRKILHPMIEHFITLGVDVWLLFDTSWMFTEQAVPYLKHCHKIIAVPRLKWFIGTDNSAMDDCAWYLFKAAHGDTVFVNERK